MDCDVTDVKVLIESLFPFIVNYSKTRQADQIRVNCNCTDLGILIDPETLGYIDSPIFTKKSHKIELIQIEQ